MRFYVKADIDNIPWLYIQKKNGDLELVASNNGFKDFGLNLIDNNSSIKTPSYTSYIY